MNAGGIPKAIIAASINNVPDPHIGSIKVLSPRHPDFRIMPAASTSFSGASVCATRYPRLCSDSPELSSESVQVLWVIWILNTKSGLLTLTEGRCRIFP